MTKQRGFLKHPGEICTHNIYFFIFCFSSKMTSTLFFKCGIWIWRKTSLLVCCWFRILFSQSWKPILFKVKTDEWEVKKPKIFCRQRLTMKVTLISFSVDFNSTNWMQLPQDCLECILLSSVGNKISLVQVTL